MEKNRKRFKRVCRWCGSTITFDLVEHDAKLKKEIYESIKDLLNDINYQEIASHDSKEQLCAWLKAWHGAIDKRLKEQLDDSKKSNRHDR